MSCINIYKPPQYLSLSIKSAIFDPVDSFISKTLFEKHASECLHINITYIKLSDQYFLINVVLYHSRNKNYKRSSECCIWKWFVWLWSLVEWRAFQLHFMLDYFFITITYRSWVIYYMDNIILLRNKLIYNTAIYSEIFSLAVSWWAGQIIQEFKKAKCCDF